MEFSFYVFHWLALLANQCMVKMYLKIIIFNKYLNNIMFNNNIMVFIMCHIVDWVKYLFFNKFI